MAATIVALGIVASGCGSDSGDPTPTTVLDTTNATVDRYRVTVLARLPHDPEAFTQGLTFDAEGTLWESTGLEGQSTLRRIDPTTGESTIVQTLGGAEFGEGLAVSPEGLVQLTWLDRIAHRWSPDGTESLGTFAYHGEGWGLTWDGEHFIQSDGSATLTWRDPATFASVRAIDVTLEGKPVDQLNELEWVSGRVMSNVWHSDEIMIIDPDSGAVTGVVDASTLWNAPERTREMTLNGIAVDPDGRLWLTGKLWPELFVVELTKDG